MKMIDRFMLLVKYIDEKNKSVLPSPILIWKIYHRRYEILKAIDKITYTADDLRSMAWIIDYGKKKWNEDVIIPSRDIRIDTYGGGLAVYSIKISSTQDFTININPTGRELMDIVEWDGVKRLWSCADAVSGFKAQILKVLCYDTIKFIVDRLIKGD